MKRLFFIFVLVVLLVATQAAGGGKIPMGLKAGLNIANISGDDAEDPSSRMGFTVGGFVEYPLSPMISVMGEVTYANKGGEAVCTYAEPAALTEPLTLNETYKFSYIEIPILLKLNVPTSGNIKPYLLLGPGVAFNIGADFEEANHDYSFEEDIGDYTKAIDFGMIFGGGVGFPVGSRMMSLGARYERGLTTIDDGLAEHWDDDGEYDIKNSVISILAGFQF